MRHLLLSLRWLMGHVLEAFIILLAVFFFLVEDVTWPIVSALAARVARIPAIAALELRVAALGPYPTLLLIALPFAVFEPLKLYGLYLMGGGAFAYGIAVFLLAEIVRTAIAARIFAISHTKLMSIGWFATVYGGIMRARDWAYGHLTSTPAWQAARRFRERLMRTGRIAAMQRAIARHWRRRPLRG